MCWRKNDILILDFLYVIARREAPKQSKEMRLLRHSLRSFLAMTTVSFLCVLSGCGYTTKTVLPANVKTIHVDIFKNSIDITKEVSAKDKYEVYRPNLEVDLRDAIIKRIFLDGNLKISDKDSADTYLEGEITQYRKDPLRYQDEVVEEYRISLICDIRLIDAKTSEVLLQEENITGDTTYFTTGSLVKTETEALSDAMSDLARRIINRAV